MFGLMVLAIGPALQQRSLIVALWRGAVVGLTAYGTFDLTSLAVIEGWTVTATIIDMCWGVVGTASAAAAGFILAGRPTGGTEQSSGAAKV